MGGTSCECVCVCASLDTHTHTHTPTHTHVRVYIRTYVRAKHAYIVHSTFVCVCTDGLKQRRRIRLASLRTCYIARSTSLQLLRALFLPSPFAVIILAFVYGSEWDDNKHTDADSHTHTHTDRQTSVFFPTRRVSFRFFSSSNPEVKYREGRPLDVI